MKKHPYISISVRLACLSHKRKKPPLAGVNKLLQKACSAPLVKEPA